MSDSNRFRGLAWARLRSALRIVAAILLATIASSSAAQVPTPAPRDRMVPRSMEPRSGAPPVQTLCGEAGQICCRAPAKAQNPAFGPLVSCKQGLGCDLASGKCVSPCGGAGQACCDGPETRALRWTPDGKVFSPNPRFLREMCHLGACDRKDHRCFVCGNADGARCCPPDAAQATARCFGERLSCKYDAVGLYVSGTCEMCGIRGRPPCDWGCDAGLGLRNGVCDFCSRQGQPPCDAGCQPNLNVINGLCQPCGALGQIPCPPGCRDGLGVRGARCAVCGNTEQPPCDNGCRSGARVMDGMCVACGQAGQPPCQGDGRNLCAYPLRLANGVCQRCGAQGEIPCDTGCDSGLSLVNNVCQRPPPPGGQPCANLDEGCSTLGQPLPQCCQTGPAPLLCVFNRCRACVPSGGECRAGGPQICCKFGDVCRLEVESDGKGLTEKVTCGLPD